MRIQVTKSSLILINFIALILISCTTENEEINASIEIYDPAVKVILNPYAKFEVLADSVAIPEGPVWDEASNALLFVDVLSDKIMRWDEESGVSEYISPAGNTGYAPNLGEGLLGPNGLAIDNDGNLLVCQHGDRRISYASLEESDDAQFTTMVDNYEGKRLNSPNDLVVASDGMVYFTDPPFVFFDLSNFSFVDTPLKELDFSGVYQYDPQKDVINLLTQSVETPNGLGLSPDEKTLYINSMGAPFSSSAPEIFALDLDDLSLTSFFKGQELAEKYQDGTDFDGMTIHSSGTIFTAGPGGMLVISPQGKLQARLDFGQITNATFDAEEEYLYVTGFVNNQKVYRVELQ